MPVMFRTENEFMAEHGNYIKTSLSRWLFHDGAVVTNDGVSPKFHDAPLNPSVLLPLRREYAAFKLSTAERDFTLLKAALSGASNADGMPVLFHWPKNGEYGPADPADDIGALRRLREVVLERRQIVEEIDRKIADLPENIQARRHAELLAAKDQRRAEQECIRLAEIQTITI